MTYVGIQGELPNPCLERSCLGPICVAPYVYASCLLGKGVPGCHARAGFASEKDSEKRIIRAHSVSSCSTLIVRSTNVCEHMSRGTLAWGAVGIFTLAGIPDIIEMSAATRRLDRGDVDLLHGHHRIKRALSFIASGRQRLCQHARRDLPGDAPLVFAPAASAFLPAIADDGVPVSIGLVLIVGRDLEREGFVMFERRTAVDADTGDAGNREFDDQHITRLARWVVTGCTVDGAYRAVGEGRGVKAGSRLGVLIVPEANRVLCHCESFRFEAR
jgi:hypothetical protein